MYRLSESPRSRAARPTAESSSAGSEIAARRVVRVRISVIILRRRLRGCQIGDWAGPAGLRPYAAVPACSILEQVAPPGRIEMEREARPALVNPGNPVWH